MANEQNLRPGAHKLTAEEASRGGKASGKARREKADLRKALEILLESDLTDKHGNVMSGAQALAAKLFQTALKGDIRAFEVLRDTAGQKPVDKVVTTNVEPDVIEEVERMVHDKTRSD